MKKALIAGAVSLAIGLVGANHFIIDYAKEELPNHTVNLLTPSANLPFTVTRVDVQTEANRVIEHYELDLKSGVLAESSKVTLIHTAEIGVFGLDVQGAITLDNEQDLTETLRRYAPDFAQSFTYQYSTLSKRIDYIGQFVINKFTAPDQSLTGNVGQVSYTGFIEPDVETLNIKVNTFEVNSVEFSGKSDGIELSLKQDKKAQEDSGTFLINTLEMLSADSPEQTLSVGAISVVGKGETKDIAKGSVVYKIDDLLFSRANAQGEMEQINLDVDAKVVAENVNYKAVRDLEAKASNLAPEAQMEVMLKAYQELLGHGLELSTLSLKINDSTLAGKVNVKAADYSQASMQQLQMMLVMNTEADITVLLDKKQADLFVTDPAMLDAFFVPEGDKFKAHLEFAEGRPSINGNPF